MAHLMPVPQGRHHRRHKAGRHTTQTPPLKMSGSDVAWILAACALPFALLATKPLPHTEFWMAGLMGLAVVATLRRFLHHPGDRRYSGINPTRQEHEEFLRTTGEIPVLEPTAVSHSFQTPPVGVGTIRQRWPWMPTKPQLAAFGVATVMTILAAHSRHRMQDAQQMEAELDELLGIPGKWNGFKPTAPTYDWGTPASMEQGPSLAERQWMALHGYEQARFSEEGARQWRQGHLW